MQTARNMGRKKFTDDPNGLGQYTQRSNPVYLTRHKSVQRQNAKQGLARFNSAKTFQNSIISWTMPRNGRFKIFKNASENAPYRHNFPSSQMQRKTTLGLGIKRYVQQSYLQKARDNPGPNRYEETSQFTELRQGTIASGKTFGITTRAYDRVYRPNQIEKTLDNKISQPGPAQYLLRTGSKYLKQKNRYTLREKGVMFNCHGYNGVPSGPHYKPSQKLHYQNTYKKIKCNIGYGQRVAFENMVCKTPGPGNYYIPSQFDKYKTQNQFTAYNRQQLYKQASRRRSSSVSKRRKSYSSSRKKVSKDQ